MYDKCIALCKVLCHFKTKRQNHSLRKAPRSTSGFKTYEPGCETFFIKGLRKNYLAYGN